MTNSERIRKIGRIFMDAGLGFGSVSDHEFFLISYQMMS